MFLIVSSIVILAVLSGVTSYTALYNESLNTLRQHNRALINRIDGFIENKEQIIEYSALLLRDDVIHNDDVAGVFYQIVGSHYDISNLYVGFLDGNIIFGSAFQPPDYLRLYTRPWYIAAVNSPGRVVFSSPYFDISRGQMAFSSARTVGNYDDSLGVVALDVPITSLLHAIDEASDAHLNFSMIADANGNVLAHPDAAYNPTFDFTYSNLIDDFDDTHTRMFNAIIESGLFVYGGHIYVGAPLETTGWYVITRIESDYVIENLFWAMFGIIGAAVFSVISLFGVGRLFRVLKTSVTREKAASEMAQTMISASPTMMVIWDEDLNIIDCNQKALDVYGFSSKDEFKRDFYTLWPEYQPCGTLSNDLARDLTHKAFGSDVLHYEWLLVKDGEQIPVEITSVRLMLDGKPVVIEYMYDLRLIRATIESERQAQEFSNKLLDHSPLMIDIWDPAGNIIDCNQNLLDTFGYSDKKTLFNDFNTFFPALQPCGTESFKKLDEMMETARKEGSCRSEWIYVVDGEELPIESILVPIEHQGTKMFICYSLDLRPLKAALAGEREAQQRERALVDASPIACFLLDADRKAIACNGAATGLLLKNPGESLAETYPGMTEFADCRGDCRHCPQRELRACPVRQYLVQNYRKIFLNYDKNTEIIEESIAACCAEAIEADVKKLEFMALSFYGELIPIEVTIVPVAMKDTIGFAVFLHDLRESKLAQEEAGRRESAEEESRAKTRFLARMSHEIRTPMNVVLGITETMLQKENNTPEVEEAFSHIFASSRQLLTIINDILDLSRVETGKLEINPAVYEIASFIVDTVQLNLLAVGSKEIDFSLHLDENLPTHLIGDELRIKQIMHNLLTNAFQHTDSGRVELVLTSGEKVGDNIDLIITVKDTGHGMTADQVKNLFDIEFTRFNMTTNRAIEGSGLGMSITHSLILMMGGEIIVESAPGNGSVFTVTLPQKVKGNEVLGKEIVDNLQNLETPQKFIKRSARLNQEPMPYGRVLVVDDVESNLYVAKSLMLPYKITIDTAESGYQAINRIEDGSLYDIIFMDHMMPDMDGVEATKIIRNMGYKAPIVALTANAVKGAREMFLENGFSGFISKPVDVNTLDSYLVRFIRDKQPPDVIAAARANAAATQSAVQETPINTLSDGLIKSFIKDAGRAVSVLSPVAKMDESVNIDQSTLRLFTIQAHAMKSALANIGRPALSEIALMLERAGREGDLETIRKETPNFLECLTEILQEITPEEDDTAEENPALLIEQLRLISAACDAYDKRTARGALNILSSNPASKETRELIDELSSMLLRGDFEEAAELAKNTADEIVNNN